MRKGLVHREAIRRRAELYGSGDWGAKPLAWELYQIKNGGLCAKTTFYKESSAGYFEHPESWIQICGR